MLCFHVFKASAYTARKFRYIFHIFDLAGIMRKAAVKELVTEQLLRRQLKDES